MSHKHYAAASSSTVLWQRAKRKRKEGGRHLKPIVYRQSDHNINYEKLICGMLFCSQALIIKISTENSEPVGNNRKKERKKKKKCYQNPRMFLIQVCFHPLYLIKTASPILCNYWRMGGDDKVNGAHVVVSTLESSCERPISDPARNGKEC